MEKGKKFSLRQCIQYVEGGVVSKQLLKKATGNISIFAFDTGEGLSEHTAPFDAVVEIIEGIADISIAGKSDQVAAGESIILPANIPHGLHAVERFKMVLTMIKSE